MATKKKVTVETRPDPNKGEKEYVVATLIVKVFDARIKLRRAKAGTGLEALRLALKKDQYWKERDLEDFFAGRTDLVGALYDLFGRGYSCAVLEL